MKCLFIVSDIGYTAPGIVYETIINELSKSLSISLISLKTKNNNSTITYLTAAKIRYEHYRVEEAFFSLFGRNILDDLWIFKQKHILNKKINKEIIKEQDCIVSLMSNHNYKSLLLGYYLSQKYKKKWVVYSVDAVPAPIGWSSDNRFYRNTRKFISRYLTKCDAFFSSNKLMLEYQLSFLNKQPPYTGVIYTPIRTMYHGSENINNSRKEVSPIILYTGGIYGPRKIEALLDAFRKFLGDYPTAKLVFVGTPKVSQFDFYEDLINSNRIEINGYAQDLSSYYDTATALIDVNAFFDNDIFLSSKVVNYLPIRKPIISITGMNSPSRNIFTEDESIIHCTHDKNEIYKSLRYSVTHLFEYNQRKMYIEKFMPQNVVKPLWQVLRNI